MNGITQWSKKVTTIPIIDTHNGLDKISPLKMLILEDVEAEFFSFLPDDWKEELFPQWVQLKQSSPVYALCSIDAVHCMGILFEGRTPQLSTYEQEYASLFQSHVYLGYLYTLPEYRLQSRARYWLDTIKAHYKNRGIWLCIEELNLQHFYELMGFQCLDTSSDTEQILFYSPN